MFLKRESEAYSFFQEHSCPVFSLFPPAQCSPSHCYFDNGNIIRIEVGFLPHPPYSPYLAPSDYHLSCSLEEFLGSENFNSNEKGSNTVQAWVIKQSKNFYSFGIKKLPEIWNKCIAVARDYIVK